MKRNNIIIILAVIIALSGLSYGYYISYQSKKTISDNENVHQSELEIFKNKLGQEVAQRGVIQTDLKTIKFKNDSLQTLIDGFKKPEAVVVYKTLYERDTITIHLTDTIETKIPIKISFDYLNDPYIKFSGVLRNDNIILRDLYIPNTISFVVGKKRVGKWYNRSLEYKVNAINSNPNITSVDLVVYKLKVEKHWYENPFITIPVGFVGGYIVGKL